MRNMNGYPTGPWNRMVPLAVAAILLALSGTAFANGIDLPKKSGVPGEEISLVGHDWLSCCPRNTPVQHVRLFLVRGDRRIELFDATPNEAGEIETSFIVPNVRPGRYRLEACSEGLQGGDPDASSPSEICLPEGRFRITAGEPMPRTEKAVGASGPHQRRPSPRRLFVPCRLTEQTRAARARPEPPVAEIGVLAFENHRRPGGV